VITKEAQKFIEYKNLTIEKREERKPTRCNNIDDLLSIVDVDY